jgi:hypothetical protein
VLSTSAASRIIVLFSFSAAVLSAFGFENLINDVKNKKYKTMSIWLTCFVVLFAILWSLVIFKQFVQPENIPVIISNLKLPSVILFAFILLIIFAFFVKDKRKIFIFSVAVLLLVSFDQLRFVTKWYPFESKDFIYPKVEISKPLSEISGYDRIFGSFSQEASEMYSLPGLEGYDPLYIKRYGEFIASGQDGLYHTPVRSAVDLSKNGEQTGKILNFLGVKYIVHKIADGQQVWAFPFWTYPVDQFRSIYKDNDYQILINDKVSPRAFITSDYKVETNKRDIIKSIFSEDLNLKKTAILEEEPGLSILNNATGSAKIKNYQPNKIEIEANANNSSLLVLTDPYYPGWKAYVDGKPAKIYRTDYAFRGVVVPKGQHEVIFKYKPDSFRNGLILAGVGIVGVFIMSLYLAFVKMKKIK